MLILCSNGLSSKQLLSAIVPFVKKRRTAAIVVTADNEYKHKNYHIPRNIEELQSLNLSTELFDIDVSPAEQLLSYDVVEFIGGNPFYLLNSLRVHRSLDILKKIAQEKVLIGWSAAAAVFGPSLDLLNQYTPEMNFLNIIDLSGLSLTDIYVLPHYNKFLHRFHQFEEICREFEIKHNTEVVRLNDGDGVLINGDKKIIIRG